VEKKGLGEETQVAFAKVKEAMEAPKAMHEFSDSYASFVCAPYHSRIDTNGLSCVRFASHHIAFVSPAPYLHFESERYPVRLRTKSLQLATPGTNNEEPRDPVDGIG